MVNFVGVYTVIISCFLYLQKKNGVRLYSCI